MNCDVEFKSLYNDGKMDIGNGVNGNLFVDRVDRNNGLFDFFKINGFLKNGYFDEGFKGDRDRNSDERNGKRVRFNSGYRD